MANPRSPLNSNHLTKLPLDPIDSLVVLGRLLYEHGMTDEVVLIGGQALYLWSLRYPTSLPPFEQASLTSKDLDYVRRVGRSIELLASTWGAKGFKKAGMDDPHTPHEALIYFIDIDDRDVVVDILDEVMGIGKVDVMDKADRIDVADVPIWIMNPIHCLYSRIANAFGRGLSEERFAREVVRIKGAIEICHGYLSEMLDEELAQGEGKNAVRAVNYLVRYCRTAKARRVARQLSINVSDALPMGHAFWDSSWELQQFRERTMTPAHEKLAAHVVEPRSYTTR